ncbi:MAG: aminotransferase class V-fold PLP-dependent enzyme [Candidatus Thorarchaeota archaeon]
MSVNWEKIRKDQFPALKKLTYLMAASASPLSKNAYQYGINYFKDMLNFGDIHFEKFNEEINKLRSSIAQYINAEPEDIAFFLNVSSCMNAISRILEKGEILYPSLEFPASIHIFKRLGFPCTKLIHNSNKYLVSDFTKQLTKDTRYIIHSHVLSLTGFKQNLDALGQFCSNNNLLNIINATQSFGAFQIDVKKQDIDMLVINPLKWGACGYGAGFLYINNKIIEEKGLPFSGWLSVEEPFSMDNDNLNVINKTKYMDTLGGCPNFGALLSLKGSLDLIKSEIGDGDIKKGIQRIQERIIWLTSEFIERIINLNYKIITPLELEFRSGIITIEHSKAEQIHNLLVKKNIYPTLKMYPRSEKHTLLRFAFNYYNNFEDIEKVISGLKSLHI